MELKQMEYFQAVVEAGSISEAARRLHIAQPPLSYQIKNLELELGVQLFERGARHITLTEAGHVFYSRTVRILELAANASRDTVRAGKSRTLYFGLTPSTIPVMQPILKRFSEENPTVRYQIYDGSTFELRHLLDTGVIDAAVLRTPFPAEDYTCLTIRREPMVAAIPSQLHPGNENIPLDVLAKLPLSVYRRYSDFLLEAFESRNLTPDIFSVCDDARTTRLWCETGQAAAIFPASLADSLPDDGNVRISKIDEASLCTDILFVTSKKQPLQHVTRLLRDTILS